MIVLDTHALLWVMGEPKKLSRPAASAMRRQQELVVPSIFFWEVAMLVTRGKLRLGRTYDDLVADIVGDPRTRIQDITPTIAHRAAQLSAGRAMDPADQIIAATAIALDVPLVSADERMRGMPGLRLLW